MIGTARQNPKNLAPTATVFLYRSSHSRNRATFGGKVEKVVRVVAAAEAAFAPVGARGFVGAKAAIEGFRELVFTATVARLVDAMEFVRSRAPWAMPVSVVKLDSGRRRRSCRPCRTAIRGGAWVPR